jgi:hypothetical protein
MPPQLVSADGEWFEWRDGAPGRRPSKVFVRITQATDGRFHLRGLRIDGPVSAELLRSIPVGRIEGVANTQLHTGVTAPRRRPQARIPDSLRASAVPGYPDPFYDAVAVIYQQLVGTSPRPVAELASANAVPVTTAQRWVREARRRGKLPPGRPGKSG